MIVAFRSRAILQKVRNLSILFAKNYTTNLDFFNFSFNSEQLTTINHSSRQEHLHNNAFVGLL